MGEDTGGIWTSGSSTESGLRAMTSGLPLFPEEVTPETSERHNEPLRFFFQNPDTKCWLPGLFIKPGVLTLLDEDNQYRE